MNIRRKNTGVARKMVGCDPEETKLQENFAKSIDAYISVVENKYYNTQLHKHLTSIIHRHTCSYELLSNDKAWCAAQCRKEQKHLSPPEGYDYCDVCPKMTYIAFDNDLNVVYARRTFT